MVEVVTASLEDQLVDPLSCRLTQTASYITKRISCTFRLQGSNIYRPTSGTKRIKNDIWSRLVRSINFSYNVWFLKNDSGALPLYLVGGVWGFFTRLSIWISAQVIEDIDSYNRAHEMFQVFSATDSRANDYGEVFFLQLLASKFYLKSWRTNSKRNNNNSGIIVYDNYVSTTCGYSSSKEILSPSFYAFNDCIIIR